MCVSVCVRTKTKKEQQNTNSNRKKKQCIHMHTRTHTGSQHHADRRVIAQFVQESGGVGIGRGGRGGVDNGRASHKHYSSKHSPKSQYTHFGQNTISKHYLKTLTTVFWRFDVSVLR